MSTQAVTPQAPLNALVTKVRAAHPGAYDDFDDAALTKKVLAKYPEYSDLAAPSAAQAPGAPSKTLPESGAANRFGTASGAATANAGQGILDLANSKRWPIVDSRNWSELGNDITNVGKGLYKNVIDEPATRMERGDIAGGLGEFLPNALMLKAGAGETAEAIPAESAGRILGTTGAGAAKIADISSLGTLGKIYDTGKGVIRGLRRGAGETTAPQKILDDLDATPENKPYAGAPKPKLEKELDATGENKPFLGGMDEYVPPKKPTQSAAAPVAPSRIALPVTELEKPVLGRAAEMTNKYPVQAGALASPERILSPIESMTAQPAANTAEATDWHNQALQMAKEKLGPQAPLGSILQEAAKIQQAGPSVIAPEFSPEAQNILGRLGKNAEQIRAADAARATEPDDLSKMLESPDFIERSVEAVKAKRLAAQKAAIIQ